jgi:hypothetical protein
MWVCNWTLLVKTALLFFGVGLAATLFQIAMMPY